MSQNCPKGDEPCIRGCKGWECRDGWPEDRVTCGGGLPGDPNGEQAARAVRPSNPRGSNSEASHSCRLDDRQITSCAISLLRFG